MRYIVMIKDNMEFVELVELSDVTISLEEIEKISVNLKTKMAYEEKFEDHLYSNIILYLTHKTFGEKEAKQLWINVLNHQKYLKAVLYRDPGIVVSCLDYMSNFEKIIVEPKIIEKGRSDFILSSTLIDNLTNLYIRNVFTVVLEKEMELSKRELLPLSILLMDVDDFKDINDTYGHAEGDRVLRQIGNIINLSIRNMDFAARYGGEELIVIMPNTSMKFAIKVGNIIRERISSYRFGDYKITVSGGVSQMGIKIKDGEELIKQADQALYLAKSLGKDKIIGFEYDKE